MSSRGINIKFLGAGLLAAAAWPAYLLTIRRWHERWGATDEEVGRPMPGDEIVAHPWDVTTRAISIKAEPEHIWPWLAQMGYQRGGMYSYDWIDQLIGVLDQPSSERVLPEFQVLRPGDVIPIGYGPDWPIEAIEPQRSLVLNIEQAGIHISWSFLLDPTEGVYTRLILRIRIQLRPLAHVLSYFPISDFGQFLMTRKMLLGIKQRAESLAKS